MVISTACAVEAPENITAASIKLGKTRCKALRIM
jgi:hypothetical protein